MQNNNKSHIHTKFSVVVLCVLVVLPSASPCGAITFVFSGQTLDISGTSDYVVVYGGMVNLRPGADVGWLDVYEGTLNVYGGIVHNPILILSDPDPLVTVYGAGFAVDGLPLVDENGQPL